jgi:hypothetical protein
MIIAPSHLKSDETRKENNNIKFSHSWTAKPIWNIDVKSTACCLRMGVGAIEREPSEKGINQPLLSCSNDISY